jgi:hypothetical protein
MLIKGAKAVESWRSIGRPPKTRVVYSKCLDCAETKTVSVISMYCNVGHPNIMSTSASCAPHCPSTHFLSVVCQQSGHAPSATSPCCCSTDWCCSTVAMLASMMSLLSSQQRRLLSGHKHISFSRDQSGEQHTYIPTWQQQQKLGLVTEPVGWAWSEAAMHDRCCLNFHDSGRMKSHATVTSATEHSGRRRRRRTERTPTQQEEPQQLDERTLKQASSRTDRDHHKSQAREQFLQHTAKLGVIPASELEGRPKQQRVTELPWTLPSPQQGTSTRPSRSSSADSSAVDALSESTLSTNSDDAESSSSIGRAGSSASSTSSRQRRSSSRASEDSSGSEPGISWQLSEEQQAVAAAISRIGRFMDFRERCASEVVTKLTEVGYDRQFAYKVLEHMQQTVRSHPPAAIACVRGCTACMYMAQRSSANCVASGGFLC